MSGAPKDRVFGSDQGKLIVPDDFDEPLEEFERDFYGPASSDVQGVVTNPVWQRKILDERLVDIDRHPEDEETWEEVKAQLWPDS